MFAVYMLTQHPDITRQLREEIIAHVGEVRAPTYDDFRDMKYLRAFLNGLCFSSLCLAMFIFPRNP